MAKVSAQRAAELTGKSKSTIQRAMKQGKLSCDNDGNRRLVDVSELERVYGLVQTEDKASAKKTDVVLKEAEYMLEIEKLKMQIKMLETQLDDTKDQILDLKAQRDQWQKQASQVLLTSQQTQEQSKTLQQELDMRRRRDAMMRKQAEEKRKAFEAKKAAMQRRVQTIEPQNENNATTEQTPSQMGSFWEKIRGRG